MAMVQHKRRRRQLFVLADTTFPFLFAKTISEVLKKAPYRLLSLPKTQGLVLSMTNQFCVVQTSISAAYMKWLILKKTATIIMKTYIVIQCVTQH